MIPNITERVTLEQFEAFIARPENHDKLFEYIGGEIVQVPSNPYVSKIAMLIGAAILLYLAKHDIGHVTGEAGGYIINGERYAPDVAFISYDRQQELAKQGYNPNPPELAVELISDPKNQQEQASLRRKLANYLAVGTVVWVVNPFEQYIEVYQLGQSVKIFQADDTLTGDDVLPEFSLKVADIFPEKKG